MNRTRKKRKRKDKRWRGQARIRYIPSLWDGIGLGGPVKGKREIITPVLDHHFLRTLTFIKCLFQARPYIYTHCFDFIDEETQAPKA